uniref:Uncharacterized protein n=1 Tax=Arion vulgaris TaxID=1028688 RepID=A0A0B7BTH0_9EUPU
MWQWIEHIHRKQFGQTYTVLKSEGKEKGRNPLVNLFFKFVLDIYHALHKTKKKCPHYVIVIIVS